MSQTKIKGLPVFAASLEGCDGLGMVRVSLVDDPAVMVGFQTYGEAKHMDYAVQDEEQRVVFGVLMRANFPIYREDKDLGQFFIMYRPDVIRQMAEKYMAEGKTGEFDLMHDGKPVDGVDCVQMFIKDSAKGINPAGFEDVEDGSLFGEFHVNNDDIWAEIKAGTYRGFSIEIYNTIEPVTGVISTEKVPDELLDWLESFYNNNMTFTQELKIKLARILGKFGNVTTDKAILSWDGDGELEPGAEVFIIAEDGTRTTPEDGEYKTEDDKVITVKDGKVEDIKDEAADEPTDESTETETEARAQFNAVCERYAASYNEKMQRIREAIANAVPGLDFYIYDAGDDFAVIEYWDNITNTEAEGMRRYALSWDGDNVVLGEFEEGHMGFISDNTPAGLTEPTGTDNNSNAAEFAAINDRFAQVEQSLAGIVDTLAALNDKFSKPAAAPAHDSFARDNAPAQVDDKLKRFATRFSK